MRVEDLDYDLPTELVAQSPIEPRDQSRLLVIDRQEGKFDDRRFFELGEYLRAGDVLVLNDTKVIRARLTLVRDTGSRLDALFVREHAPGRWELMIRGIARLKIAERLTVPGSAAGLRVVNRLSDKTCLIEIDPPAEPIEFLEQFGRVPLPPYIHRQAAEPDQLDRQRYQTVYSKVLGAVAAPTAGLHFTEGLLQQLKANGIKVATVTLHVGRGTFEPIAVDDLSTHPMHSEWFSVSSETADLINSARSAGGRVIAVGTTAVRVIESAQAQRHLEPSQGWTDVFIYPPYEFKGVDSLVTNFHLPRTTLLALVYAFAGIDLARKAYGYAITEGYRFYSYGDAMLIV